uniref:Ig-like domain-containing protein n=1 Tax=Monodelphis domestica TaxID=13616 RepID=A0A5F8GWT2_MONDO
MGSWDPPFHFSISPMDAKDAGITQDPRHIVTGMGQTVTLGCEQTLGHDAMYWYRQDLAQGLQLIYYSLIEVLDKSGVPKTRFSIDWPQNSSSILNIQFTEPQDSAIYLCSSSLGTALYNHFLSLYKPSLDTTQEITVRDKETLNLEGRNLGRCMVQLKKKSKEKKKENN